MAVAVLQRQPEEQTIRKLTISEYHKLAEVGVLRPKERVELLDGLLVQMAPIGPRHQSIVDLLTEEFSAQNKARYKVSPGRPIPIPDFNEPQPDMVLFKKGVPTERHPSPNETYLVVEVSETTLTQDEGKKLLAYRGAGIPEYWIVDVAAKNLRVYRLNQGKSYSEKTRTKGTIALQAFPDVTIDIGNLFCF
jgi:Uma2 family endonuclease